MKTALLTLAAFGLIVSTGAVLAQDDSTLTAEQLAAKFLAQQATRGLVIAPSGDAAATATDGAAALPQDVTRVALDPSAQVNFQIKFAFDSAALETGEADKLTTLCEVIKASDIPTFNIIGTPMPLAATPITRTCPCCGPKRSSAIWSTIAACRPKN